MICEPQVFVASGGLKPSFFLDFGLQVGLGNAKASDRWLGGYRNLTKPDLNFQGFLFVMSSLSQICFGGAGEQSQAQARHITTKMQIEISIWSSV